MISIHERLFNLLEEDLPLHLMRADDSVPPPPNKKEGYNFSHSHRIALPLAGCHRMEIARKGKRETIRPERGWATLMPRGVWNMVDWHTPVEVATFIFDGGHTYVNHILCSGQGRAASRLTRLVLPPLGNRAKVLMELLLSCKEGEEKSALKLIWLIIRMTIEEKGEYIPRGKADHTYRSICSWLSENWTIQPTREEVASLFSITPNYLSGLFRNQGGTGFSEYLTGLRLLHARRLLRNTNQTLGEIGYSCGYPDPAYFCRIFKKHAGMTPTEYRLSPLKDKLN